MATQTPQEQLRGDINEILDKTYKETELPGNHGHIYRREEKIQERIYELNAKAKESEGGKLNKEDEAERTVLIDAEEKIAKAVAAADLPQNEVLGAMGATPAAGLPVLADRERIAQAKDGKKLQETEPPDITEGEGKGSAIIRAAYQCFLLYNIEYFAGVHRNMLNVGGSPSATTGYLPMVGNDIQAKGYWSDELSAPRMLLTKEDDVSSAMVNKLSICPGNEDFSNIKNHEYAQLSPLLKIYKMVRNGDGDLTKAVEMEFSNSTSRDGIDKVLTTEAAIGDGPTSSLIKGAECGVQSFEWTYLGTDPYTATRDIKAKLKIFFQHFSSLVKTREGQDLMVPPIQAHRTHLPPPWSPVDYRYVDLIIQPDCRKPTDRTSSSINNYGSQPIDHQPECYEIRVDVGYHKPPSSDWMSTEVQDAICCQRSPLYLTPVDHSFDFGPDGTMVLTINYRGRLENLMKDRLFNVLMPGGGFIKISFQDPYGPGKLWIQDVEDDLKAARQAEEQELIKKHERNRGIFFANAKQFMYNGILDRLQKRNMIWRYTMKKEVFDAFARWQDATYAGGLPDPISSPTTPATTSGDASDTRTEIQKTTPAEGSDLDPNTELQQHFDSDEYRNRLAGTTKSDLLDVDYVYLGDLIGAVVSNTIGDEIDFGSATSAGTTFRIGHAGDGRSPSIFVSPSLKTDVLDKFKVILGNINLYPPGNNSVQSINMAHIPISLEAFQDFMVKNVLSKNTLFYSLFDFLNDLVSDLVTHMFSTECFGGMLNVKSRVGASILTSPTPLKSHVYKLDPKPGYSTVDVMESTPANPAFDLCVRDSFSITKPYQYLMLNILDTFPRNLAGTLEPDRGDPLGDRERGILHFTYGMDRGLLKSAEFSKTNQEYLPEARFAAEGEFVFNQLSNVYDASFNMIGNNIFKPGMHIYFDPAPMGAGMPWQRKEDSTGKVVLRSWSNIMGLGGYHLVTEIASSIKPGKFDTVVKARWVTSGDMVASTEEQEAAEAAAADAAQAAYEEDMAYMEKL